MAADGNVPAALRNRPDLPEHLLWLWDAFHELSSDRHLGMAGAGPIMFSSLDRYACRFGIEGEHYEVLTAAVRGMDAEWQEHMAKAAKSRDGR
jgi:hypothetical protein